MSLNGSRPANHFHFSTWAKGSRWLENVFTTVPWRNGRLLVWDATCPDTFAPSYTGQAVGEVAAQASVPNTLHHIFVPVATETAEVIGPQSLKFLKELGRRIRQQTGDSNASLLQRLSMAIQRGTLPLF